MDLDKIKLEFPEINDIYFGNEMGIKVLKIEVGSVKMDEVENISKNISNYINTIDHQESDYRIEVFSPGVEKLLDLEQLSEHLNKYVEVVLIKGDSYQGKIRVTKENKITINENNKGRIKIHSPNQEEIKTIKLIFKI